MKVCKCPNCGVLHGAARITTLAGLDEEQVYLCTHCRFCEYPTGNFVQQPDERDLQPNELGYPMAVVPWLHDEAA